VTRWRALLSVLVLSTSVAPNAQAQNADTAAVGPSGPPPTPASTQPQAAGIRKEEAPSASDQPRREAPAKAAKPGVLDLSVNLARGPSWDVSLEGGGGVPLGGGELDRHSRFMGRLRVGLLLASEPLFLAIGAVGELGGLVGAGAGLQVEILNAYSGLSAHTGVVYGGDRRLTTHLGVGLAIFAIEWTHSYDHRPEARNALFFKVHVPIGVIVRMMPHSRSGAR